MQVEDQIRAAVTRYGVRSDWMGTKAAGKAVYSLYGNGKKVAGPLSHPEVLQERTERTVRDILAVIGEQG